MPNLADELLGCLLHLLASGLGLSPFFAHAAQLGNDVVHLFRFLPDEESGFLRCALFRFRTQALEVLEALCMLSTQIRQFLA